MPYPSDAPNEPGKDESGYAGRSESAGYVATVPTIRKVGIGNLCEVESHQVTRIANSTSHVVRFFGGGELFFAFTDKGELLELSGHRIQFDITEDGHVDVSPYIPAWMKT